MRPRRRVRLAAAEALGRLAPGSPEAIAALVALLRDPEAGVRHAAAQALGRLVLDPSVASDVVAVLAAPLLSHIPSVGWSSRVDCADLLAAFAHSQPVALDGLFSGLKDPDNVVREACARGLGTVAARSAAQRQAIVARLLASLGDPDFSPVDDIEGRSGHDYAFDALWSIFSGSATS